ncbi:MAG: hypothetical protein L3J39_07215 [Verrucomicrobiales bacterium]|nr:hypothetical protein [Verrucomicrobiales bacterium]
MNIILNYITEILIAAAIGQLMIAAINLRLDKLLLWQDDLKTLPKLLQQVFTVHKWFITITLLIFATITLRFASDIGEARYEMTRWFAAGVGFFWLIRTAIQWFFYSWDNWRGKTKETLIHWTLTFCYGGAAFIYLLAAFQ